VKILGILVLSEGEDTEDPEAEFKVIGEQIVPRPRSLSDEPPIHPPGVPPTKYPRAYLLTHAQPARCQRLPRATDGRTLSIR
jgi:hypothetical protein